LREKVSEKTRFLTFFETWGQKRDNGRIYVTLFCNFGNIKKFFLLVSVDRCRVRKLPQLFSKAIAITFCCVYSEDLIRLELANPLY